MERPAEPAAKTERKISTRQFRAHLILAHECGRDAYDCALVGFFLSHLTETQEGLLFAALKNMLDPSSGRFLILDSAWSAERARFNAKAERQERRLNDGKRFEIYKRYFDQEDLSGWANKYDVTISIEHFGTAFFALSGRFMHGISARSA